MRTLLIIFTIITLCASCGKKGAPEYKSRDYKNKTIYRI